MHGLSLRCHVSYRDLGLGRIEHKDVGQLVEVRLS